MDARRLRFDLIQSRYRDARYDIGTGRLSTPSATLERIAMEGREADPPWLRTMAKNPWIIPTDLRVELYFEVLARLGEYVDEQAYRAQFSRPMKNLTQIQDRIERLLIIYERMLEPDLAIELREYKIEAINFVLDRMVANGRASFTVDERGLRVYERNKAHQENSDWVTRLKAYFTRPTRN